MKVARTEVIVAVLMMIAVFKDMTPCCLELPWRWKQLLVSKRLYRLTLLCIREEDSSKRKTVC